MKMQKKVIVLIGLALFLANASFAQLVKTDYDRAANFSQYKTCSWEKVQTPDPLSVDRIKAAVDAGLAAKGWAEVESGGDISIIATEINRDHQTLNTYYDDFGGGWRWRGFGGFGESTTTFGTYTVGTLVVDLFDAKTKHLVWRGVSSGMLSDKVRQEHQEPEQGSAEDVSALPSRCAQELLRSKMTRHFSTSLSLVLFSAGSHLRAANKPHANRALDGKEIWTNDDSEQLSDHRPVSIVGQIREEVTDAAAAPTPHITPAIRLISVFQRHLLNPEHKEMMEKVLFQ